MTPRTLPAWLGALTALLAGACSTVPHFIDDTGTGGQTATSSTHATSSTGAGTGGATTSTTGGPTTSTTTATGTGGGPCVAKTCAELSVQCGAHSDGCQGMLDCGGCTLPDTCGGAGVANTCGCTPTTCAAKGAGCGVIPDACHSTLNCGDCTLPATCGGGGTANVCGCTPTTCAAKGAQCGTIPDGCGGTLGCGVCAGTFGCTPGNVCAQAVYFDCTGGCQPGFNNVQSIPNDQCNPGAPCGSSFQYVCAAVGSNYNITQNPTCLAGYHPALSTPFCNTATTILVCVHD